MPELPEVETTRLGIAPHLLGRKVRRVLVRQPELRLPVSRELAEALPGHRFFRVRRRAKYLLLETAAGTLIIHLGMSGSLRILPANTPPLKHDHLDVVLDNGDCLRLRDPRRFGTVLWTPDDPLQHPLFTKLGPEPWDRMFSGDYLYRRSRGRRVAVKNLIMDSHIVVGVGNIYANEALFAAGVRPDRIAGRVSRQRYDGLVYAIRAVLEAAIRQGGTTLRDFVKSSGEPGYFGSDLRVYLRAGMSCNDCGRVIKKTRIGQRSSFFCPRCQR